MLILELLIGFLLLAAFLHFYFTKRKHEKINAFIYQYVESSEEMKKTLAMGLDLRFKKKSEIMGAKHLGGYLNNLHHI